MIRRGLTLTLATLLALMALLLAGAALLLGSETGNRWLLERVRPLIPGELSVTQWQGTLLTGLQLGGIDYRYAGTTVTLDRLGLDYQPSALLRGWLTVDQLQLGRLEIHTAPAEPTEQQPPFTLPDSLALPLGVRIEHLLLQQLIVNDRPLVSDLEGQQLVAWRRFNLARLSAEVAGVQLDANLQGQLTQPYPMQGQLNWQMPLADSDTLKASQARGQLVLSGPLENLAIEHRLSAPVQVQSQGKLALQDGHWRFDLTHRWQAQPLPLQLPQPLALGQGQLITRGDLNTQQLQLRTGLKSGEQALTVALDGKLANQQLSLSPLTLSDGQQSITASGQLALTTRRWQLDLQGKLNPQWLLASLPGSLTLNGNSRGQLTEQGWQLEDTHLTLDGTLRDQPAHASASVTGNARALNLQGQASWADNRIRLEGRAGDSLALHARATLPRTGLLDRRLGGQLNADLRLTGSPQAPQVSGQLQGNRLRWQQWQVDHVDSQFRQLGPGKQPMALQLTARGIQQQGQSVLGDLTVDADGRRQQHRVAVRLEHDDVGLSTRLQGALSETWVWQGRIDQTRLQQQQLGSWQQASPAALTVSADQQSLGSLCLKNGDSDLCLAGQHGNDGRIQADLQLDALPLSLANGLMAPLARLDGNLTAKLALSGTVDAPRGTLSARTGQAHLLIDDPDQPQTLAIEQLQLDSQLDNGRLTSKLDARTPHGIVQLNLQNGLSATAPMDGDLTMNIDDLSALSILSPDVRNVEGRINSQFRLGGTPHQPIIQGQARLTGGHALVPRLGVEVNDLALTLDGSPLGELNLKGQARLGDGTVHITGNMNPARQPLDMAIQIRGDHLLVADRPDAKAWVSPDLTLGSRDGVLTLRGKLAIPEADIRPVELPAGAITVSDDQVLVHQQVDTRRGTDLDLLVTLTLGEQVHFNGFGLNADLGGSVQVQQQPGEPLQLNGELLIRKGRYRAYGQNLAISDGRLVFQGAPDNPGLDIRAIRKIPSENQTVGVRLTGTLQEPKATIFSEPNLEQSQAMSYLLTGRPLERGSNSDGARVAQALALYGLEKGSGVTEKIGDKLGLDEVTVGSDWETNDAALMLGKQISDRLYLSYAVGLFDAVSTVMLRYTLTTQLHLEARSSSKANSLDLIWEKELH
ncbi:hypothetical protein A11A3_10726 [Alcanivorax hongdengensis A-11-3]|uniref:Translocation and assembly module TamB C-terminal domain-containing protein n=1 Tax=Alcanivorax hongdengensis A-11-3 TaxID=1177179 RepID=L0WAF5_9GAMM|nr:translocation/assembly module TamB domain-containing protein [Alcanivorax hongdengensis]EKF73974.1 hypothetical protein A11A3_10726 [Alcanivorax hongdengensis A-11-3]